MPDIVEILCIEYDIDENSDYLGKINQAQKNMLKRFDFDKCMKFNQWIVDNLHEFLEKSRILKNDS